MLYICKPSGPFAVSESYCIFFSLSKEIDGDTLHHHSKPITQFCLL